MKLTFKPENFIKEFSSELTIKEIARQKSISFAKTVYAALVDGYLRDLNFLVHKDSEIEFITKDSAESWSIINHTTALVCATAICEKFPYTKLAKLGHSFEGFYVDFEVSPTIKKEDLAKIENQMKNLIKSGISFEIVEEPTKDLPDIVKGNEYLMDQINDMNSPDKVGFWNVINNRKIIADHVLTNPANIKFFHVSNISGVYWKDDSSQKMIQRIQGLGHHQEDVYKSVLKSIQDRKERDHRRIGKSMEIFTFDNMIGQGLPIWLPNGKILKNEIQAYIRQKEWEYDFQEIETPVLGTKQMYQTSGHLDHYQNDMFKFMEMGNEFLVPRPMACPHHIAVYKFKNRSYRELPIRYSEHAVMHRYEASGALTGLERVRMMTLTDSHIFARHDQIKDEVKNCFQLITEVLSDFNIDIDYFSLSLRDPKNKDKYFDDDKMWNNAEAMLEECLEELGIDYKKNPGEAAFYGPKLDVQIKSALNHEITVSTIQLDFLLPNKFDINYLDADHNKVRPIIIHRGLVGTFERFISILLEQTKGILPLWLSPKQIDIIPISNQKHFDYSLDLKQKLKKLNLKVNVDSREERLNYKIRESQISKVPYQIVIGDKEVEQELLTYREYGHKEQRTVSFDEFIQVINEKLINKK